MIMLSYARMNIFFHKGLFSFSTDNYTIAYSLIHSYVFASLDLASTRPDPLVISRLGYTYTTWRPRG